MSTRVSLQISCWLAGLTLVLAGCSQTEAPKSPTGATSPTVKSSGPDVSDPAGSKDGPVAKLAPPASLEEATRVIDFRKFPLPDDGKDLYKSAAIPKGDSGKDLRKSAPGLYYHLRKADGAKVAEFYRSKLAEAGWKLELGHKSVPFGQVIDNHRYFYFTASKQGFFLDGYISDDRMNDEVPVSITNVGNVDSRTLPRFAGAELKENRFERTTYQTDAKQDAVLEFTRAELAKSGWREVMGIGGKIGRGVRGDDWLRFIQRGMQILASARPENGKTEVSYQVSVQTVELPIMSEKTGPVEFWEAGGFRLRLYYNTQAEPEKVLDFYRKELPPLGWSIRAGTDKIEYGKARVRLEAADKAPLWLELLADKEGTAVLIANALDSYGKEIKSSRK